MAATIKRSNIPSLGHGAGIYVAEIDVTAVGDATLTFATAFRSVPTILSCSLVNNGTGAAGVYPTSWVKTVSATALTVTLGGAIGTLGSAKVVVLLEAEA